MRKIPVHRQDPPDSDSTVGGGQAPAEQWVRESPRPVVGADEAPAEPDSERLEEAQDAKFWQDRALRLQAEMENYRRRQRRWAEDRARAERERLLRDFLMVVDDLQQAVDASVACPPNVQEGLALTYRKMVRLLDQEGVELIAAADQLFDPQRHEAVDTVGAEDEREMGKVVKVVREGYRLGDRVLRPARVVVAT